MDSNRTFYAIFSFIHSIGASDIHSIHAPISADHLRHQAKPYLLNHPNRG